MSLTNRLSLFFLATLALVLAGFSVSVFFLFRMHLYAQLDDRVDAAMRALVAAVEVHPRDVQWEPLERRIGVGEDASPDQPRWALHDLTGRLRDRSHNLASGRDGSELDAHAWRVQIRRLSAGNFTPEVVEGNNASDWVGSLEETSLIEARNRKLPEDRTFESDGLVITVAASEAPVVAMLRWLAFVLAGVSASVWLMAALWGRWLCRRALHPISRMAASARSIRQEAEPKNKIDVPATGDELEDLGRAFNELLTDLHESLERQRRFSGDASHQLRTPLTAMLASVEVALRHDRSSAEYQRVLEVVKKRGGQLRQIIESLLFLARADGSTLLGAPERIDVKDWCETWLNAWAEHPRASDLTFRTSHGPAETTTHPALLGQVLDNLLDNACKYSEPGTPVSVEVEATSSHVCVIVRDSGYGIASDQLDMIFEPFFRTNESRWQGKAGIGLGLAIVRRLVAILGAKVEVMSEQGKGSRFSVLLRTDEKPTTTEASRISETATLEQAS